MFPLPRILSWSLLAGALFAQVPAVSPPAPRPAPQSLRVDHFVPRGEAFEAALVSRDSGAVRICGGGLAEVFGARIPAHATLLQWLQGTDVVAAVASDLPFWSAVGHDGIDLVGTNVRDRDDQPLGLPFHVESVRELRLAVFAVVLRPVPAGYHTVDALSAVQQALPAAQQVSDAALVVVDGDVAAARALLAGCPALAFAIVTGGDNGSADHSSADLLTAGPQAIVQSPRTGRELGQLSLQWDGAALRALGHQFAPATPDVNSQPEIERFRAALQPLASAEDDAGVVAKGLAGFGIERAAVDAAIARGAAFLQREVGNDRTERQPLGYRNDHVLMALAMVHAGVPQHDADFARALQTMLQKLDLATLGVYSAGLFCMLVEAYGHPEFYGRLRVGARYLVEGQAAAGSWTYTPKVDPALLLDPDRRVLQVTGGTAPVAAAEVAAWQRTMPWTSHPSGDNSLTQFALLGLRAAQRCSVPVPQETWRRAALWFRRGQRQDGAFGYEPGGSDGYGSMTLAGIGGLAIAEHELGNVEFARDESIRRGFAWLRAHFSVDANPLGNGHLRYYLYSLERTGRIFDREVLSGQEWYPLGVRALLATQAPDGSWPDSTSTESPRIGTSFALLFLTRATQQLRVEAKHGGSGTLRTFAQTAPGARLYVILDASGSMLDTAGDGTRFDLARAAIENVLGALPEGPQVALRVYGHRKRAIDAGADEDTELLVPFGAFEREAFFGKLRALRARGKTPLARSLRAAATDLGTAGGPPTTVVVLTDGGEDSMPRQDPTAAAAALGAIPGLRLHVVGFDIQREDWQIQLRAMAAAGHGEYLPADHRDLAALLRAAVLQAPEGFALFAADGAELRRARFGDTLPLPEGTYRLATEYRGQPFATELTIGTDTVTSVVFDGSQAVVVQRVVPGALQCPGCHRPVAANAKFCPECGARLAPR